MGLILPRWGLILPRIPTPNPFLYSAVTHSFLGYVRTHNTPKFTSKHPFSWPELESGPMNYHLGKMDPTWAKCLKNGQNFSRSRPKKKYSSTQPTNHTYAPSLMNWVGSYNGIPVQITGLTGSATFPKIANNNDQLKSWAMLDNTAAKRASLCWSVTTKRPCGQSHFCGVQIRELTRIFPRIDRIFSTATLKQYFKG